MKSKELQTSRKDAADTPKFEGTSAYFDLTTKKGQILFMVVILLATFLIQLLPKDAVKDLLNKKDSSDEIKSCDTFIKTGPKYFLYGRNMKRIDNGHLKHVIAVFDRLGFTRVYNETDDWDIMWAHDFPFTALAPIVRNLEAHRRVNHIPATGFITNKVDLALSRNKYIPKAFELPKDELEFREYAKSHPEKMFVQKSNQHRDIYIKAVDDIDFQNSETFIQEYIDKPFLVDGYKFDIGIYVIITSINPLRVYMYNGDILFRYCPVKYYPFDPNNVDKYVVGDDYLPTWEVPALQKYCKSSGFGMKGSFDAYVRSLGRDPDIIWKQTEDAIRSIILENEVKIIPFLRNYQYRASFFEMIRFDLIIDDDFNVYVMEANMSPNLSSDHFQANALLYEQVLYNIFSLLNIGSPIKRDSFERQNTATEHMQSANKNIVVDPDICGEIPCVESCAPVQCELCLPCLSSYQLYDLHAAFREHVNRGETKRIFPPPINIDATINQEDMKHLSQKNQMIYKWFIGKCKMDRSWC